MIPDQILDSVSASRRTVVVLSRSYLNSTWSRMEFQAAHTKTMEEKTQVSEWTVARGSRTSKPFYSLRKRGNWFWVPCSRGMVGRWAGKRFFLCGWEISAALVGV